MVTPVPRPHRSRRAVLPLLCALGLASPAAAAAAPDPAAAAPRAAVDPALVRHLPPVRAFPGEPLAIEVEVGDIAAVGQLVLAWREVGTDQWSELGFDRVGPRYWAQVPGRAIHRPGIEYAILSRDADGHTRARFASLDRPHPVHVTGETAVSREQRLLASYGGHRSTVRAGGGMAGYGRLPGAPADQQWSADASFTYRTLQTLHLLRFSFGRMRGQSPLAGRSPSRPTDTVVLAGYDRGGAEAHFALGPALGIMVGTELGVDLDGFTAGGSTGLRIGQPTATHVWARYQAVGGIGQTAGLALHWDTVPRVPMHAAVEATTWPTGQDWATRLRAGAALPLGDQLALDLEASYQARSALAGGPGGQAGLSWSF